MLLSGLLCQNIYAGGNDVHFYASIIDHSTVMPGGSKSPIRPLTATLEDHTHHLEKSLLLNFSMKKTMWSLLIVSFPVRPLSFFLTHYQVNTPSA